MIWPVIDVGNDTRLYRRICAQFATGITVVTTLDSHGHPHGMTVNSFSSVSLDPPLVLVSIDLKQCDPGPFRIQLRGSRSTSLPSIRKRFHAVFPALREIVFSTWSGMPEPSGAPLLEGVLAQLECSVVRTFEAGDHAVLIGEVRRAGYGAGRPLLYFDSGYRYLR